MPENKKDNSGGFLEQVAELESAIANERVLLAKAKVKHKRLTTQVGYQRMLLAVERDMSRQLAKLQNELQALTHKSD